MARYFEKISFEQFKKDIVDDRTLYDDFELPKRKTKCSAGYDLAALEDFVLKPGERKVVGTGIKYVSPEDEMFMILIRSSLGFKYNIRLCNQVGIIESDYYNNPSNEGHVMIAIQNEGKEDFIVHKKDRIAQGIFVKFLTIDNEEEVMTIRTGGMGSTDSK